LDWVERAGYQDLEDIEPITVAAYIETLQRQGRTTNCHISRRPGFAPIKEKLSYGNRPLLKMNRHLQDRSIVFNPPPTSQENFRYKALQQAIFF
jgi:hypothetical protein